LTLAAHQADGSATLKRNSASFEGHDTPLADFRPARGLDASSSEVPPPSRVGRPSGEIPPRSRTGRPPRVRLRLARGLDTPSSGVPPRSKASRTHCPHTCSPDRGIQCTDICKRQGQKRIHATPLTRLGITPRRYSANPPDEAIPTVVRYCAVRPVSAPRHCATHSCMAARVAPSKEDGGTLLMGWTPVPRSHGAMP
jgi:hypothetical protein